MMEKCTVMCVYWEGDFKSRTYSPLWVERLKNMVDRNLSIPHDFVCLSNAGFKIDGVQVEALNYKLVGWWSKMEMYRQDIPTNDRILFLDLDILVLQDLSSFVNFPYPIALGAPFGNPNKRWPKDRRYGYNNSVVVFDKTEGLKIWNKFTTNANRSIQELWNDQDWMQEYFPDLPTFPVAWLEKIGGCIDRDKVTFPSKCKIMLCMPIKNDEAAQKYPQVAEIWR